MNVPILTGQLSPYGASLRHMTSSLLDGFLDPANQTSTGTYAITREPGQ
jgi:hypothetical protein